MKRNVDREDLYVELPRRFHDATRRGEINGRQYLLGCFLAGEVHFKTGEVSLTLRALADSCDWQWSGRTLLRDLHVLRPAWIEFQVGQGQRRPYVFSLTGLRRRETAVRHDFDTETPSSDEVTSTPLEVESASIPQPERVSASSQLRHGDSPKKRREETKQDETTTRSEEKLDHVLGETTTRETDPAITDRLVEKVGAYNDRDRLLSDDEIAALGALPLDELHRLRERGEL